jgi:hypothetical protein
MPFDHGMRIPEHFRVDDRESAHLLELAGAPPADIFCEQCSTTFVRAVNTT